MSETRTKNSTGNTYEIFIRDAADPNVGKTGLAFDTAGLNFHYAFSRVARVAITKVDLASVTAAFAEGGFKEIGGGLYRLDAPNAAHVAPNDRMKITWTGGGTVADGISVDLTNYNPFEQDTRPDEIKERTDNLPDDPADASNVQASLDTINTNVGTKASQASVDTLATAVGTKASQTSVDDIPNNAEFTAALTALGPILSDAFLARNAKGGSNGPANQSVAAALAPSFMKFGISGVTLTVNYADGTPAFTRTITRAQADAITGSV